MKTLTESYVHIDGIRLHARHGVLPQEQLTGNDYIITVSYTHLTLPTKA